jgi:hypothetical protein
VPLVYGEPLFVEAVAETLALDLVRPASDGMLHLPEEYRQRFVRMATLEEARLVVSTAFIKSAANKSFSAAVYSSGSALPHYYDLPETTPVLIAEPVTWEVEFRMFVLDRKIATFSPYRLDGKSAQTEEGHWITPQKLMSDALEFTQNILDDSRVKLPLAFVMDVGSIEGRGWAVVSMSAVWSAGMYGSDADRVLSVLRHACPKANP